MVELVWLVAELVRLVAELVWSAAEGVAVEVAAPGAAPRRIPSRWRVPAGSDRRIAVGDRRDPKNAVINNSGTRRNILSARQKVTGK
ncbi:hypothetical protein [Saccharothrix syringae]|uniref:hypothetical protein n=1 Tax=Saccharothrix syringae TaxID=103733 RepID=UPI001293336D|nr:hypothetical protein [Saccharothrix syringae]